MVASAEQAVVCPVLIGREDFLGPVSRALEGVREGAGHTVAISGEAGIGKSRMIAATRELAASILGEAPEYLQGNCFEPDAGLPYAPILDLLRGLLSPAVGPMSWPTCIGPEAPDLAQAGTGAAGDGPGVEPAPALDPEQEKRRIFHALNQFFARIAERGPLLIVIEDLHWSDDTSLEFLLHLARRGADAAAAARASRIAGRGARRARPLPRAARARAAAHRMRAAAPGRATKSTR